MVYEADDVVSGHLTVSRRVQHSYHDLLLVLVYDTKFLPQSAFVIANIATPTTNVKHASQTYPLSEILDLAN